jgi:hypothetical protein
VSSGWAEVRARDRVTRYRRAGSGRVVLLLCAAGADAPVWPELEPALVRAARVVMPELAADAADVVAHLLAFLEGLGVTDVGVVAADPFCTAALELALRDGGQVARVVLVAGTGNRGPGVAGCVTTPLHESAVPLLVVGRGAPAADAVASVTRFVHGDD